MSGIISPEEFLGFKPGTDRKLADWPQIVEYFQKVATVSDRVKVDVLGDTTEGNPFIRAIVTSAENLANIEEIRKVQMRICNPEGTTPEEEADLVAPERREVMEAGLQLGERQLVVARPTRRRAAGTAAQVACERRLHVHAVRSPVVHARHPRPSFSASRSNRCRQNG